MISSSLEEGPRGRGWHRPHPPLAHPTHCTQCIRSTQAGRAHLRHNRDSMNSRWMSRVSRRKQPTKQINMGKEKCSEANTALTEHWKSWEWEVGSTKSNQCCTSHTSSRMEGKVRVRKTDGESNSEAITPKKLSNCYKYQKKGDNLIIIWLAT